MVDDNGNIYLDADQQCPILFKFFSFREAIVSKRRVDLNDPKTLTPRTITIKIFQQSDDSLIKSINLNIIPRPNPIDHTFRFYSPENSYLTLSLPSFTSIPLSAHPDLSIQCSLPSAQPIVSSDQVQLSLKTPFSPEVLSFGVFVYQDSFCHILLAACQVKLHALTSVFTTVRTGVRKVLNLPLFPTRRQQAVMIYTDEPEVASEVSQRPVVLESSGSTNVQLTVKTFKSEQKNIIVN